MYRFIVNFMFFVAIVIFLTGKNYSNARSFNFQSFNFDNTFIPNKINSIVQDDNGYIWLGSDLGLYRFDGNQIKLYKSVKDELNSISSNFIFDLKVDTENNLWVATDTGLNRINLTTDRVTRYLHDANNMHSLIHNRVKSIDIDKDNNLWVATEGGLSKFDTKNEVFRHYVTDEKSKTTLTSNRVRTIKVDSKDNIWIGYESSGLSFLDSKTEVLKHYSNELLHSGVTNIALDANDNLWFSYGLPGVSMFDHKTARFSHISPNQTLNSNEQVSAIHTTKNGDVWFGTFKNGVFIKISGKVNKYVAIQSSNMNPDGIESTQITQIYEDRNGNVWLTTASKGVYFISYNNLKLENLSKYSDEWDRLTDNTIWSISEDSKQRLWLGTNSKGVQLLSPKTKKSLFFRYEADNDSSLSDDTILDIIETKSGQIWLAASRGLNLFDEEKQQFKRFFFEDSEPLSSYVFSHLIEDNEGYIWASTFSGGVVRIKSKKEFEIFQHSKKQGSISDNFVTSMIVDHNGTLWLGTRHGLNSFDSNTGSFLQHKLPADSIWSLALDINNENLLVGSADGLIIFDPTTNESKLIDKNNELTGSMIYCILSTEKSIILSTNEGISTIDLNQKVTNYSYLQGVQQGYNLNACEKLTNDTLYFGGDKGISSFKLNTIAKKTLKPTSLITDFKVYDEISGRYISEEFNENELQLPHSKNSLKFYFTGILFEQNTAMNFKYRLVGLNDIWSSQDIDEANIISKMNIETMTTYTNLSPNYYQFQVQFQSDDGIWSDISSLSFEITAPWWQTTFAYLSYLLLIILSVFTIVKWRTKKLHYERRVLEDKVKLRTAELEEMAKKAEQLTLDKSRLFTNVSHEFKTPLTLILGPLEQLINTHNSNDIHAFKLIQNNANRLLHLVERLLSFSKIGEIENNTIVKVNVNNVIMTVLDSFQSAIINKNIKVEYTPIVNIELSLVDNSFETILINLISNALKYTEAEGSISVEVAQKNSDVLISVADTGIGISQKDIQTIFDYFSRSQVAIYNNIPGTGIGLALVKQLVTINNAELFVESEIGSGSIFTLKFAVHENVFIDVKTKDNYINFNLEHEVSDILDSYSKPTLSENLHSDASQSLLVIEDNIEMNDYIKSLFNDFKCFSAKDGEQGIEIAERELPDMIICDVMMPSISGFDVITHIRASNLTCHIPILMLTAKGDFESRQQGWELQADEYISKPFQTKDLINRVNSLLSIRSILKKRFSKHIGEIIKDNDTFGLNERDQHFISKFESVVRQNYHSPDFNRKFTANELAMSERQLNRKLSALVDHNFSEYLRKYRLTQSLTLQSKGIQIAQVAEAVGFSSLSYFSTCFKAEFGKSYSEYLKGSIAS